VAAILQIPAFAVPHFVEQEQRHGGDAICLAQKWLHVRGYWILSIDTFTSYGCGCHLSTYSEDEKNIKILPSICVGPTVRSKTPRQTHCVVMNWDKLLYDPHPSEAGLLVVTQRYIIIPHYDKKNLDDTPSSI
jgi:hypothetical protein